MSLQIINPITSLDQWISFLNKHSTARHYVQGTQLYVSCWDFDKIVIGNLSNAYVRGAVCAKYTLEGDNNNAVIQILEKYNFDLSALLGACEQLEFTGKYEAIQFCCGLASNFPTQSRPTYPLHASDLSTSRIVGATIWADSGAN